MVQSIDTEKSLAPISASSGRKAPLKEVNFEDLKSGTNEGQVVVGKVICSVHSEDTVPL